ncbi:U3 snoRNP protein Nop14 [Schizosaccharomyces cryophilus OY26]|uniref:U3 snoRNP protein Nop14 n=1 Tax=Schizosaccharomyces cryophilus (strain OY26 / ATCC MYA-4695 / CBS 11777 / NBRC 106824 / NRRL Y48691) TaxID=653667 RepID=S9VR29_SCHCR|nr:U3 snoRNP protein Nop14 [Schizosaccharomyces cryophilus OY26]EPY50388.1 U3 snoRNP protein Nop14 [Schizosaccharomyces cryophilus OY26]
MGKNGSQLKNLKTSIRQADLFSSKPGRKKGKKKGVDSREDRQTKVDKIQSDFNLFDRQFTRSKFDVGGRRVKGTEGIPGVSRSVGEEIRKKTIGEKLKKKNHVGGVIDRRFGENNPHLSLEEKMLERFSREQQRRSKKDIYNLDSENDVLTHGKRPISDLDDFDEPDLALGDEDDEGLNNEVVRRMHFGGFGEDEPQEDEGEPKQKKSKQEVMSEIIAKSKTHKAERQADKDEYEGERERLDEEMEDLQSELSNFRKEAKRKQAAKNQALRPSDADSRYDEFVREMVFDRRARPSERTKTEEELAQIEADRLRELEDQRLTRMQDDEIDYPEAEAVETSSRATDNVFGFGKGLMLEGEDEDEEESMESSDSEEEWTGIEEGPKEADNAKNDEKKVKEPYQRKISDGKPTKRASLAYTYPCPTSHKEFLGMIQGLSMEDQVTVVTRIRTLYHVKLHPENKARLENFSVVLLQHILYLSKQSEAPMEILEILADHMVSLGRQFPETVSVSFISVLEGMRNRLLRSFTDSDLKFPDTQDLVFFNLAGSVFPTSDRKHIVLSPMILTMCESLSQSPWSTLPDLCRKLYLANILLKYQRLSHRYIPEVIVVLGQVLYLLCPDKIKNIPGTFTVPDSFPEKRKAFGVQDISLDEPHKLRLTDLASVPLSNLQSSMIMITLNIVNLAQNLYAKESAFLEIFEPIFALLQHYQSKKQLLHKTLSEKVTQGVEKLATLLESAKRVRKPLTSQAHRPVGIASQLPKFEEGYSVDRTSYDIDPERAERNKLRAQHRDAKKGAIRTLRKDARYIARERQKEQRSKDKTYNEKMGKLHNRLQHFDPAV